MVLDGQEALWIWSLGARDAYPRPSRATTTVIYSNRFPSAFHFIVNPARRATSTAAARMRS